jgi:CDP-diacylglycerol--glycerol-3-phosphate 3-phosphatidyltransferase
LFFILMASHHFVWALVALFGTVFDLLDGLVARANNRVTGFGALLDSSMDRVGDFLIILGFYAAGLVRIETTAILLTATFLISYIRSRAELASGGTIKFNYGLIERPERIIFFGVVLLAHLLAPGSVIYGMSTVEMLVRLLTLLSVYTVIQRILLAYKML